MLVGALIVVVEAIAIVYARPPAGAWLLAAAAVAGTYSQPRGVVVGDFQVYVMDVVTLVLVCVVVLKLIQRPSLPRPIVILVGLSALALARGAAEFETQTAVNATRGLLPLIVAVGFACVCLKRNTWDIVQRLLYWSAAVYLVSAVVFVARHGLGTYASSGERALAAAPALVVGQAGILALVTPGARWLKLYAMVCLVTLLVSEQRTVWGATLACAIVIAIGSGRLVNRRVARSVRLGLVASGFALVALLTAGPSSLQRSLTQATSTASTDSGTLGWRVEGWASLLNTYKAKPIEDKFVGQPFGSGFARTIDRQLITVSPHNMYITVLLSLGAIGLASLVVMFAAACRRAASSSIPLLAVVVGLLVFSVGYQLFSIEGLVIGAALTYSTQPDSVTRVRISRSRESLADPEPADRVPTV